MLKYTQHDKDKRHATTPKHHEANPLLPRARISKLNKNCAFVKAGQGVQ